MLKESYFLEQIISSSDSNLQRNTYSASQNHFQAINIRRNFSKKASVSKKMCIFANCKTDREKVGLLLKAFV